MTYAIVIEKEGATYGASVPDLPGCVAVAKSLPRVKKLIQEAIELHLEDMKARGEHRPRPRGADRTPQDLRRSKPGL